LIALSSAKGPTIAFFHRLQYILLILPLNLDTFRIVRNYFYLEKTTKCIFLIVIMYKTRNILGAIEENLELQELEVQHPAGY
jgi:hypothetical protein